MELTPAEEETASSAPQALQARRSTRGSNGSSRRRRVRPSRGRGLRTSTGCLTCRKRRVKCDEARPCCLQCSKATRACVYPEFDGGRRAKSNGLTPAERSRPEDTLQTNVDLESSNNDRNGDAEDTVGNNEAVAGPPGNSPTASVRVVNNSATQSEKPEQPAQAIPPNEPHDSVSSYPFGGKSPVASRLFEDGIRDTGAEGYTPRIPDTSFRYSLSPSSPGQLSLLEISPFEWYDLLAQDAITNIQRFNELSNGDSSWNFDHASLSRKQSPLPDGQDDDEAPNRDFSEAQLREHYRTQSRQLRDYRSSRLSISSQIDEQTRSHEINSPPQRPWNTTSNVKLSSIEAEHLRYFVDVVAPMLDIFDPDRHFTNLVPHMALRNTGILKAVLAVAARHRSIKRPHIERNAGTSQTQTVDSPQAEAMITPQTATTNAEQQCGERDGPREETQYYYETLQYLSQTLLYPKYADSHEILVTAIMISTYEMFEAGESANSGDWERHLRGTFWIQRSQNNNGESGDGLRRAVWWAWLRQDTWAASQTNRSTLTIFRPHKRLEELDTAGLATRILYIAAKCVEYAAYASSKGSTKQDMTMESRIGYGNRLLQALREWRRFLPSTFMPINNREDLGSGDTPSYRSEQSQVSTDQNYGFAPVWIHPPSHAAATQMYHFAKTLVLLNQPSMGGLSEYRHRQKQLNDSLEMVCGIASTCQEHDAAMALVSAQAILVVAQSAETALKQSAILRLLERMLAICKFPMGPSITKLMNAWKESSV